jgi:tripartite ATP-independent transporter DctP family solute receptor
MIAKSAKLGLSRRTLLAGAALPLFAIRTRPAGAAEFEYRFATGQSPTNPINLRLQEAIDRIAKATDGRVAIKLFPNNQLGSDTDLISQIRAGGVEFLNISNSVLSILVPQAALVNVGFAFSGYDQVWKAADGELGHFIDAQIEKTGLLVVGPPADNGFRQITSGDTQIRTPDDLKGFHIRVPVSPIFTSLFQALGASPTSINFNEVYTALQTKLVGGQENGLVVIETAKLFEVQKYVNETSHIWDCFALLGNRRAMGRLPADAQEIVRREIKQAVMDQRADAEKLDSTLKAQLQSQGMTFVESDKAAFRAALQKSTFYADWRAKLGDAGWTALQSVTGALT